MCCSHCHGSVGSFAGTQHFRKALGIFDLILHMVEILKHGEMTVGIGFHHSIPVFEMLLDAAELEKCMLLQFFREYGERLVLQTAQHLAALSFVRQGFSSGDEIGLMSSSSHHKIFFSVPPFDQYRLLIAKYKNGVITRRVPFAICANCPPSKKTCPMGSFVPVKKPWQGRNRLRKPQPVQDVPLPAISDMLPSDEPRLPC